MKCLLSSIIGEGFNPLHDPLWRLMITDLRQCNRAGVRTTLSAQLKQDATSYTQKFLWNATAYISIMVRLEYFYISHRQFAGVSNKGILSMVEGLYSRIMGKVNTFKAAYKISEVFLTMDCRKQGSNGFSKHGKRRNDTRNSKLSLISNSMDILYKKLYGNSSNLEGWEETFYSVSSFRNSG